MADTEKAAVTDKPAYEKLSDPRASKKEISADYVPGHLVVQLPHDAAAASNALNAAEGKGFKFAAVYTHMGLAFAVMTRE